ncbi:hypothetical protein P3X46_018275 [Hevea brasiliensis]|uniref:Uncharacterized protein n=1 Tax=Hevea brasiliensis TaxID=3981 RepID=A0ABQ9LQ75_HEVBR|nr:transcription factor MYB10 [Hevea brasiliensis]KAJ9170147.1 hypothetical protein P3X46_018275 [Hevea brasiliensis]
MVRAAFFDKNGLKKGAWSPEEDDKLKAYIMKYGHWNWRELPKFAGLSRCGKSCRLRWMNYLRPGVKYGNYSKEEGALIMKLHKQLGNKWSKIAAELPGRTDNEIKNYWHTHLKKRTKESQSATRLKEKCSMEQSSEIAKCEVNSKNEDLKDESSVPNNPLHPILESSPLSPEPSSNELSYLTSDSSLVTVSGTSSSSNWIAGDGLLSFETFESTSEDFWTQPFVADPDGYRLPLPEGGLGSSYLTSYDDVMDLFYQGMQDVGGISSAADILHICAPQPIGWLNMQ